MTPAERNAWLEKRNADPDNDRPRYRLPELFATDLYRVFNEGEEADPKFESGGRLFGGWWMYVPGELRKAITINKQPTVELDYANCHPRMLYHERGVEADGDLYELPGIADAYRDCIKWLMQILINGRGRPEAVEPPETIEFPPDLSITQIVRLIEEKHQPFADAFRTGAGLRLMRVESDIALEIVFTAMRDGWTVLPVHDSFIAPIDHRDRLRAMMIDAYVRRLGKEPVIKEG